ncbi:UPF0764 protein C16orf89 homolog isoform X1 [Neodiprion fabricii]|uniref:UPF0764 protein C16orf89 homolog isoform X1 n=1 Tax=Neodiprion fabricii TaxID=2872261 RepID=UPI001ED8FA06|nr:UPF0764 protein C16orf89 homolog isoform X1 [Neodiprion fabricii]
MPGAHLIRTHSIVVMKLRMLLHGISTLISVVIISARQTHSNNASDHKLGQRILALYRVVDFMAQRPRQMNVDAIFGLTIAEAHVASTVNHEKLTVFHPRFRDVLIDILELCRRARRQAATVVLTKTKETAILNQVLNQPEIWQRPVAWSFGLLGPRPPPSENNTESSVLEYFYKGTPNETESDRCLSQLAQDYRRPLCQVSEPCAEMLTRNDGPRGYPLAHRLLYVVTAVAVSLSLIEISAGLAVWDTDLWGPDKSVLKITKYLRCMERDSTPFDKLIPAYCTAILQDAVDMEDTNFPAMSRDMICEQVILCGMAGYMEFANDHYAALILSWPNDAGCFTSLGFGEEIFRKRFKRESERMDYGCDNHATALAAASLSLLIRQFVETSDLTV